MSATSKISMRKVQRFILMSALLLLFVVALMAAAKKQSYERIAGLQVSLSHENDEENFLLAKDVEQLFLKNRQIDIYQKSLANIDLNEIERIAETNPWVRNAEVFVDNRNFLNLEVAQRSPVARIFTTSGQSFYIDSSGFEMPLSERYGYPVPVFTSLNNRLSNQNYEKLKRHIIQVSHFLANDSFWNNQISQIDITQDNTFVMVPTIGKQRILLGDTSHLAQKFSNLYSFYREVSNKIGWNKYDVLDVRFKGQVIASPSLGWVAPKDTGLALKDTLNISAKPLNDTLRTNQNNVPAAAVATPVAAKPAAKKEIKQASKPAVKAKPAAVKTNTAPSKKTQTVIAKKEPLPSKKTNSTKKETQKKEQQPKYIFKKQ